MKPLNGTLPDGVAHETGSTDREYIDKFDLEHYEVVGNTFGNPELLQEEHK